MICPNCNSEIPDGSKFCSRCGSKLEQANVEQNNYQDPALGSFLDEDDEFDETVQLSNDELIQSGYNPAMNQQNNYYNANAAMNQADNAYNTDQMDQQPGYNNAQPDQQFGYNNAQPDQQFGYNNAQPDQQFGYNNAQQDQQFGYNNAQQGQQFGYNNAQQGQQFGYNNAQQGQQFGYNNGGYNNVPPVNNGNNGGASDNNNSGIGLVITVAGIIGTVVFAFFAVKNLFAALGSFINVFTSYWGKAYHFFYAVGDVLKVLGFAVMAFALITIALKRTRENRESLFGTLCVAGVANIVLLFIARLMFMCGNAVYYGSASMVFSSFLGEILWTLVFVLLIFAIMCAEGPAPLLGKSGDELKALLSGCFDAVAESWQSGENQSANRQNTAGTQQQGAPYGYQNNGAAQGYGQNVRPAFAIKTDRSIVMYVLLSIVTCGFYGYYFIYTMARDINQICEGDNQKTGGLAAFIIFSFLTCGIYGLYWEYKIANRLQENAPRYGLTFSENGTSVLLWCLVGMLLCCIGPYIAMNILIKNTNRLAVEYNRMWGLF